jgi:TolB-like protein/Flp pilus assembly protein TadD
LGWNDFMVETRVERRLAAILAGDVAGYSRLMGADEEGTLARLNAHRREFLEPKIAEYRGRIVKRTGDGVLVEFASTVDATRCAAEIQRGMSERNEPVEPDRRIVLRLGIHVGDVIIEEGDLFGDGVNIAARLEGIAEPGGICISDDVFRQVRGKIGVDFADAGDQQLKNIERPVRAYHAQLGRSVTQVEKAPAPSARPSIAVLPFQNMSGDPEQEYFADGMVDEIITGLSRIKWLMVVSRNSTFIYKNKPIPIKEVADKLRVRYVLEGGVRKAGNRVRITAQLIDAETDNHLWAEQYDRLLEDVFALQDEISMCVVGAIEPSVRKAEVDRIKRQRPNNFDAYDLLLRSQQFVFAGMPKEATKAIPLLEEALKLESDYSAAHAYLSWCFHSRYGRGGLREEDRLAAIQHARAAIAFGSDDATALAIAALVLAYDGHETDTALKVFDRALELSNSNIFVLCWNAAILAWTGKTDLAVQRAQLALRLGPFDSMRWRANHALAVAYFHARRYGEAMEAARNVIDVNPVYSLPRAFLVAALVRLDRMEEARTMAKTVLECDPSFTIRNTALYAELEPAVFRPMADAWREAGLPE